MTKLAEFWILGHLIFLYPEGFTVFCGQEAEYTNYSALALLVGADAALLFLWKWIRPAASPVRVFFMAIALGAAGMLAAVTQASRLSSVAAFLTAAGALLGIPAFGLWAVLWYGIGRSSRQVEDPT